MPKSCTLEHIAELIYVILVPVSHGNNMPSYCSFLVFDPNEIDCVLSICVGLGFNVTSVTDPSKKYRFLQNGVREIAQPGSMGHYETGELGQLLIFNEDETTTDNFIQLVCASLVVLDGYTDERVRALKGFKLSERLEDRNRLSEIVFKSNGYFQHFIWRQSLSSAIVLAAHAWADKKLIYAIHKLAQSYTMECVTPHSIEPYYRQAFEKHTENFMAHVGTSIAINLAYSAIEELGLTVQASAQKPRFVSDKSDWNPVVLEPFLQRLSNSKIERNATIDWIIRGAETELNYFSGIGEPSECADLSEIRDRKVSVPYAIHFCEYLRNKLTAHSFKDDTENLGPYEVHNCQRLARFLILKRCEMYNQ